MWIDDNSLLLFKRGEGEDGDAPKSPDTLEHSPASLIRSQGTNLAGPLVQMLKPKRALHKNCVEPNVSVRRLSSKPIHDLLTSCGPN